VSETITSEMTGGEREQVKRLEESEWENCKCKLLRNL